MSTALSTVRLRERPGLSSAASERVLKRGRRDQSGAGSERVHSRVSLQLLAKSGVEWAPWGRRAELKGLRTRTPACRARGAATGPGGVDGEDARGYPGGPAAAFRPRSKYCVNCFSDMELAANDWILYPQGGDQGLADLVVVLDVAAWQPRGNGRREAPWSGKTTLTKKSE